MAKLLDLVSPILSGDELVQISQCAGLTCEQTGAALDAGLDPILRALGDVIGTGQHTHAVAAAVAAVGGGTPSDDARYTQDTVWQSALDLVRLARPPLDPVGVTVDLAELSIESAERFVGVTAAVLLAGLARLDRGRVEVGTATAAIGTALHELRESSPSEVLASPGAQRPQESMAEVLGIRPVGRHRQRKRVAIIAAVGVIVLLVAFARPRPSRGLPADGRDTVSRPVGELVSQPPGTGRRDP